MNRKNFLIAFVLIAGMLAGAFALSGGMASPRVQAHAGNGYGSPTPPTVVPVTQAPTEVPTMPPTVAPTTPATEAPQNVTICHDNGAGATPRLTQLTLPPARVYSDHIDQGHTSDIIPPFGDFPGQNFADGSYSKAIWENGCVLPGETTPTQAPTVPPTTAPTQSPTQTPTQVPGLEVLSINGNCSCNGQLVVANQQFWSGAVLDVFVQYADNGEKGPETFITINADQTTYDFHIDITGITRPFRLRVYGSKTTSQVIVCGETPTTQPTTPPTVAPTTSPSTVPPSTKPVVTKTETVNKQAKLPHVAVPARTTPKPTQTPTATPVTVSSLPITGSGDSSGSGNLAMTAALAIAAIGLGALGFRSWRRNAS